MNTIPDPIWLYHITHVDNLPDVLSVGGLWSDADIRQHGTQHKVIGYNHIKDRRLNTAVSCYPDTMVGGYVPFYFCPRSAMLFVIHKRPGELTYHGGQESIVHLVACMDDVIRWASINNTKWAFSDINASNQLASFFNDTNDLGKINWTAVNSHYWKDCRDQKQAEFLLFQFAPIHLFTKIVTMTNVVKKQVEDYLSLASISMAVVADMGYYY